MTVLDDELEVEGDGLKGALVHGGRDGEAVGIKFCACACACACCC